MHIEGWPERYFTFPCYNITDPLLGNNVNSFLIQEDIPAEDEHWRLFCTFRKKEGCEWPSYLDGYETWQPFGDGDRDLGRPGRPGMEIDYKRVQSVKGGNQRECHDAAC